MSSTGSVGKLMWVDYPIVYVLRDEGEGRRFIWGLSLVTGEWQGRRDATKVYFDDSNCEFPVAADLPEELADSQVLQEWGDLAFTTEQWMLLFTYASSQERTDTGYGPCVGSDGPATVQAHGVGSYTGIPRIGAGQVWLQ